VLLLLRKKSWHVENGAIFGISATVLRGVRGAIRAGGPGIHLVAIQSFEAVHVGQQKRIDSGRVPGTDQRQGKGVMRGEKKREKRRRAKGKQLKPHRRLPRQTEYNAMMG
jgi:hypothetical protein